MNIVLPVLIPFTLLLIIRAVFLVLSRLFKLEKL